MNWRTAIFGLLALYCAAGLIYTWTRLGINDASQGAQLWGGLAVLFLAASFINEWVVRRRARPQHKAGRSQGAKS